MHFKLHLLEKDWIALALTFVLVGMHWCVPWLKRRSGFPEAWITSLGGGFAAAYVFLHLLPSFEASKAAVGMLLAERHQASPLLDLLVYFTALVGFLVYFGLGRQAEKNRLSPNGNFNFKLGLSALALTNFIMTYTMATRVEVGVDFALLFTAVMGLHFFILDREMERHYPAAFDRQGRIWLIASLIIGWIGATITEPNNVLLIAMLSSFLAGSVLFHVFRNEIPGDNRSSFAGFTLGVVVGSLLLAWLTILEKT